MKLELADDQLQRHRSVPRMEVGKKTAADRHMGERKVLIRQCSKGKIECIRLKNIKLEYID